jgi:hypothetical protein
VLWQNNAAGWLAVWYMQGTTVRSASFLNPTGVSDLSWRVAGVGDFNGDGHPDLFWQNMVSGDLAVWFMNGLNETALQVLTNLNVPPAWRIAGIR